MKYLNIKSNLNLNFKNKILKSFEKKLDFESMYDKIEASQKKTQKHLQQGM